MDRNKAVELHKGHAQVAFSAASAKGLAPATAVVLLLELDDDVGGALARGLMPGESARAAQRRGTDQAPFLTNYMALGDLKMMIRAMLPQFAPYTERAPSAPAGSFRVLCFGDGGAEFFFVDVPVSGKRGSA